MTQNAQHLKGEIVATLDLLSTDSLRLLAKFVSFLRTNTVPLEIKKVNDLVEVNSPQPGVRVTSPRLVHRHQIDDFFLEVVEMER